MKRFSLILISAALLLSLAACGGENNITDKETPEPAPSVSPIPDKGTPPVESAPPSDEVEPSAEPTAEPSDEPDNTPVPTPSATPEPEDTPEAKPVSKETAEEYIGKTVEELYSAIGEPNSSDYAPSCLGDGEDGNLYYDDFTVYTYREEGTETVEYVE